MKIGKFEITTPVKAIFIIALSAIVLITAFLGIGALAGTKQAVADWNTTRTPKVMYYSEYLGTVQRNTSLSESQIL